LDRYDKADDLLDSAGEKTQTLPPSEEINRLDERIRSVESSRKEDAAFVRICAAVQKEIVAADAASDPDVKNQYLGNAQKLISDFMRASPKLEPIEKAAIKTLQDRTYKGINKKEVITQAEKIRNLYKSGRRITADREVKSASARFPDHAKVFQDIKDNHYAKERYQKLIKDIAAAKGAQKIKLITEFIKAFPDDPRVPQYVKDRELARDKLDAARAHQLARDGNTAGARKLIRKIKAKYPPGSDLYQSMDDLEGNLDKIASMQSKLKRAQDLGRKAESTKTESDYRAAITAYEDYLKLVNDPKISARLDQLKIGLAMVLAGRERELFKTAKKKRDLVAMKTHLEKMINHLNRALAIDPNHEEAAGGVAVGRAYIQFIDKWTAGLDLYKNKDFPKAKVALKEAETFGKGSPVAQLDKELIDRVQVNWEEANFEHLIVQVQEFMELRMWKEAGALAKVAGGKIKNLPESTQPERKARLNELFEEINKNK
ncbi:MAG: hypothetical protein R3236_05450, partial [Phycisphaeraceae bacterium]|nr:hypothetical protein [Phycisphaeraceae bacterium]